MYLNRLQIIGFLGSDPEQRHTPKGTPVTRLRVATKETWKNAQGERQESTEWFSVVIWGKLGEIAHEILKKGTHVQIEGPMKSRSYEKDGQKHTAWELKASSFLKLDRAEAKPKEDEAASVEEEVGMAEEVPF